MKLALAQYQSIAGNIPENLVRHEAQIVAAARQGAALIVFPELSITGYEPSLAASLATTSDDVRLNGIQALSDQYNLTVALGLPLRVSTGVQIGMVIFQADQPRLVYAKQFLHEDELPYFVPGSESMRFEVEGMKVVPAICYESLRPEHAAQCGPEGVDIYLASVAKPSAGVSKAYQHYPSIAKQYGMNVVMANSVGPSDTFVGAGRSAAWDREGTLQTRPEDQTEGLLLFDLI